MKGGPQLWVAKTLYSKGCISTARLWDEYVRDNSDKLTAEGEERKDLIPTKTFLKERVLKPMLAQGSII